MLGKFAKLKKMPSSKVNTFNKGSKTKDKEDKKPLIDFKLHIKCTGETFLVSQCSTGTKIRHLKGLLEFITGIPSNLQRLSYLDDGKTLQPLIRTHVLVIFNLKQEN